MMISEFLIGVVSNAAYSTFKHSVQKILAGSPVSRAINSTAAGFSNPLTKDALRLWCDSDEFVEKLDAIMSGRLMSTDFDEVQSFIDIGLYSDGFKATYESASEVLCSFCANLEKELLKSSDGLLIVSKRDEQRHEETLSAINHLENKLEHIRPDLRILVSEGRSKISYDEETSWANYHRLRFSIRETRGIEIDLLKSVSGEKLNVLEITLVFSTPTRFGFNSYARLSQLLKTRELSARYGENWIAQGAGRPVEGYTDAYNVEWFLYGKKLLREIPQLSFIQWLDRDFITFPALSSSYRYDEPRDAPKLAFVLKESDLDQYDKAMAAVPRPILTW